MAASAHAPVSEPESAYAWARLCASLVLMTLGGIGMYGVSVALPLVQAEFGVARSAASFPYAATMIGFGLGGILMGRLSDRFGVMVPVLIGGLCLGSGLIAAGHAGSLTQFALAQGLLIGMLGTSATFAPLVADTSLWFTRRRGIAVAICASGNYLGGAIWPPVLQYFFDTSGWRATYTGVGLFILLTMIPVGFALRRRPPSLASLENSTLKANQQKTIDVPPNALLGLLCLAGVACCVAMSMPQVHIVAYCGDLGFPAARGAEMLSLMLGFGVISRLLSGWICDHIGGLRTLMLGSALQGIALLLFLPFDGLASLYVVSALFGLFQGGLVPSYAIIIREYFPPAQAGAKVGLVIMCTLLGMALGGWLTGVIFDLTGSYRAAFLHGIGWNLLNLAIASTLLYRSLRARPLPA
ncbi:MAG TPA: MFS transporter [Burkholderiales bacterium]|jgi:MFS family permease|nr:MFS transporter [Burkholderiales bacterium]